MKKTKNKQIDNDLFQNKISPRAAKKAMQVSKMCKKMFGVQNEPLDFVAVPKGEVYKNFKVLTLIQRDDIQAQIDENGMQLKVQEIDSKNSIIIGTIRMGFGHWRIAIALASAAHSMGIKTYLLDFMSFSGTPISKSIKFLDGLYSRFSRFSQHSKFFNKFVWEPLTSKMNVPLDSALQNKHVAKLFSPAISSLPKEIPFVAAHPWVGWSAVHAGFHKTVSVIPDNLPLAFWLVEGSINTVQSPSAYMGYRTLLHMEKGIPITTCLSPSDIIQTGHYVDYELLKSIKEDCKLRIERSKNNQARRFLLTMGGAGAQALKFAEITKYCKKYINENKATFLINMGDHAGRWNELKTELEKINIPYTLHTNWKETQKFICEIKNNPVNGVHIFLHSDFYAAVYCTNLLIHVSDIMITKPSELSYYPIPKLFIQRVGRHEAWGAIRSSEIGDGTKEATTPAILNRLLKTLIEENDLLEMYVKNIMDNDKIGIYDGAYNVIKIAVE